MSALLQMIKPNKSKEKNNKLKQTIEQDKTEQILQWTISQIFKRRKRDGKK